jgi:hypothetical protein
VTPLGIGPRDVVALARDTRSTAAPYGPILVTGILAEPLARELRSGGDPTLVRTSGDPASAAAVVRIVAGAATAEDERVLRAATRALVPVIVVQTGDPSARLPYVLPTDVVDCLPGKGFPVDEIVRVLAEALGRRGPALAGALPVLRDAVQEHRTRVDALVAGVLAFRGGGHSALGLAQARLLADLATAVRAPSSDEHDPRATAEAVALPLAASIGWGLAARALVRRLPVRNPVLDALVAGAATFVLASLYRRAGPQLGGSVRSRS